MDASSFPTIPLLLPFPRHHIMNTTPPNDGNPHGQCPILPLTTSPTTHSPPAHDHEEQQEEDDEEEDTLSLCDLPLHNSNNMNHPAQASPRRDDHDDEDGFEFSREYSFIADHILDATTTTITKHSNNNSIVFCGKLIAHRQFGVQQQQDKVMVMNNEKKRKQEEEKKNKKKQSISGRVFPWKSFSSSSSSSSSSNSSSSCPSPEKKKKKKKKATGSGRPSPRGSYLCLAIGVQWKFPVRSMDLKDIKLRQSRRSSNSLDFDVSTSSSSSMLPDNSNAVGSKSGKGLWCLLRVLAGVGG